MGWSRRDDGNRDPRNAGHGTVVRETAKAICVRLDEADEDLWVPKSVLHDDSELFTQDDEGDLIVFEWWAEKESIG